MHVYTHVGLLCVFMDWLLLCRYWKCYVMRYTLPSLAEVCVLSATVPSSVQHCWRLLAASRNSSLQIQTLLQLHSLVNPICLPEVCRPVGVAAVLSGHTVGRVAQGEGEGEGEWKGSMVEKEETFWVAANPSQFNEKRTHVWNEIVTRLRRKTFFPTVLVVWVAQQPPAIPVRRAGPSLEAMAVLEHQSRFAAGWSFLNLVTLINLDTRQT